MEVFERRCIRALIGVVKRDRCRNDFIRKQMGLTETIAEMVRGDNSSGLAMFTVDR